MTLKYPRLVYWWPPNRAHANVISWSTLSVAIYVVLFKRAWGSRWGWAGVRIIHHADPTSTSWWKLPPAQKTMCDSNCFFPWRAFSDQNGYFPPPCFVMDRTSAAGDWHWPHPGVIGVPWGTGETGVHKMALATATATATATTTATATAKVLYSQL